MRHALKLVSPIDGVVCMLMRNEWDSAKGRVDLLDGTHRVRLLPFAGKVVLTSRPRWIAESKGSPRHNYSWFCWSAHHVGQPWLRYHVRGGK